MQFSKPFMSESQSSYTASIWSNSMHAKLCSRLPIHTTLTLLIDILRAPLTVDYVRTNAFDIQISYGFLVALCRTTLLSPVTTRRKRGLAMIASCGFFPSLMNSNFWSRNISLHLIVRADLSAWCSKCNWNRKPSTFQLLGSTSRLSVWITFSQRLSQHFFFLFLQKTHRTSHREVNVRYIH